MNVVKTVFGREPVVWQILVMAVINLAVVFSWVNWDATQVAAINGVVAAVLGLIVRSVVTPVVDPKRKINGKVVQLVPTPDQ